MCFKSPDVDAVGIIENHMKVRVFLVDVAGHKILIFAFKELLTYLLTDLQGSLRCDLPGLKLTMKCWARTELLPVPCFRISAKS